jgi:hypothetical protein
MTGYRDKTGPRNCEAPIGQSFKHDRRLIKISPLTNDLEEAAKRMKRPPKTIEKVARR